MKRLLTNKKFLETTAIIFILIIYAFISMILIEIIQKENNKSNIGCYCTKDGTFCP